MVRSEDRGIITTGAKRNLLLDDAATAKAKFCVFVDDDDTPSPRYIRSILIALQSNPDCVGFKVRRFVDGQFVGDAIHSIRFKRSQTIQYGSMVRYERVPNHLNPVKLELAQAVRFPDQTYGEDHDYANRLRPLLKTERFIDDFLYDYYLVVKGKPLSCLKQNSIPLVSTPR